MAEEAEYADACHKPTEFTVDKRCYVTDEQKQVLPYSSVVGLLNYDNSIGCSGTFVYGVSDPDSLFHFSEDDGLVYMLTAKHCVNNLKKIRVKTQKGDILDVYLKELGNQTGNDNKNGDWAIYKLNDDLKNDAQALKEKVSAVNADPLFMAKGRSALVVGYGSLKIMSDKDIEDFKEKYIQYIKAEYKKKNGTDLPVENIIGNKQYFVKDNAIDTLGSFGKAFVKQMSDSEYNELFNDRTLKLSRCEFDENKAKGCQAWAGNSGGPVFDSDNNLVGVHTRGYRTIGGDNHAFNAYDVSIININNDNKGEIK